MSKTHEEFVNEIRTINPLITIIGKYTKATERIDVKCNTCGHLWSPKAYSLSQGKGCPHCSAIRGSKNNHGKTGLKDKSKFIDDLAKVDPSIIVIDDYHNTHRKIKCQCGVCGTIWSAMPYSLLQGHGCPRCAKSGTSFMEQYILLSFQTALGTDSVISRDRHTIKMELDIIIPQLKLAIEPGNWYLHKEHFARDEQKRYLCEEHGIQLITIYDKYPMDKLPPFKTNCFVFNEDLNKADRMIIKNLVRDLFDIASIECRFSDEQWVAIEDQAYKNAKAKNHRDFIVEVNKIHPHIEILGTYQNSNKRIRVKCNSCGYEWFAVPANLLAGDGCKKCGTKVTHGKFIKEHSLFVEQMRQVNPEIEILGTYTGRHNPIKARCRICGFVWEPIASSLLRGSTHKGAKSLHKAYK